MTPDHINAALARHDGTSAAAERLSFMRFVAPLCLVTGLVTCCGCAHGNRPSPPAETPVVAVESVGSSTAPAEEAPPKPAAEKRCAAPDDGAVIGRKAPAVRGEHVSGDLPRGSHDHDALIRFDGCR